ncbi:MAG: amidohydrolase family protein [Alsobacter sp.]
MTRAIVRSLYALACLDGQPEPTSLEGGAALIEHGVIREVGPFAALQARHPDSAVIGSGRDVLLPGLVNAHHHVGLTTTQLGIPDMELEPWLIARIGSRGVDPYLDTLYSAFELIASGVTTVQHIQIGTPGDARAIETSANAILRAYRDVGMRASYAFATFDQNRLSDDGDERLLACLPDDLARDARAWLDRFPMTLAEQTDLFGSLFSTWRDEDRIRIQLAPANLQWCSDTALETLASTAEQFDVPLHMHLLETEQQLRYAARRGGGSAVAYLDRFGMLGPRLTLGHGVWLSDADLDRIAETGTCVCHNCSSNFRLRAGLAPLDRMLARGITVAIGIDEAGINDDRDMLQEMRMALTVHRVKGAGSVAPTSADILRMATTGGARTTGFGDRIGRIAVGSAADLVLIDWDEVSGPYLDPRTPVVDALLRRAKPSAVRTVICDGEVIYRDGRFTRVDRTAVLAELRERLTVPLSDDERHLQRLSAHLLDVWKLFTGEHHPS